jgi:hypothetical protein
MASSILNSDDGVVSGTSGLKTSGGDTGELKIQTNGTDAVSVTGSQVCSFANNFGTVANLPAYQCRAWVNFDGTTSPGTIRASGNVSSVTRNGTGDYTINFTTAMPDANYSLTGTAHFQSGIAAFALVVSDSSISPGSIFNTGSVRFGTRKTDTLALTNAATACISIFR